MADKVDRSVVRNEAYKRGGLNKRERHNERKNVDYQNDDICPERAGLNVYYKRCGEDGNGEVSGYEKTFDKMLASGVISTHGLGKDPNIIDELVFDVNTEYFERRGGYEYAKSFFEEAYRCAVGLVGGEQFVLSAIMHADERNSEVSDRLGRDVYHYHLHVVYVPVVRKELRFSKDNKDPELRGKLKEVITQVSHSKKWPKEKKLNEHGEIVRTKKGNAVLLNSYSLLQDRFFEHMRAAGYDDFERGVRGSDAEHLSVLEFKTQKEKERAAAYTAIAEEKSEAASEINEVIKEREQSVNTLDASIQTMTQTAAALSAEEEKKRKRLTELEKKTAIAKREAAETADIDKMFETKTLLGDIALSKTDSKKLSELAKEGIKSRSTISNLKEKNAKLKADRDNLQQRVDKFEGKMSFRMQYNMAAERAPQRLAATVADILRKPPENGEPERTARTKTAAMEH